MQQIYVSQASESGNKKSHQTSKMALSWLDSFTLSTQQLIRSHYSYPPSMEFVNYFRSTDCFHHKAVKIISDRRQSIHGVLYALDSKVLPKVTDTIILAERFRRILMGTHKYIAGGPDQISSKFSGKTNGMPMKGHRHIYILPLDKDRDGRIDHLAVVCRDPINKGERIALDNIDRIWQSQGLPEIRCIPIRWGMPHELFKSANCLISATPFVPPRHYRKGRGDLISWLKDEIRREAAHHGLLEPSLIIPYRHLELKNGRSVRWIKFRRSRKNDRLRMGYGFLLKFDKPITGPIAMGYGAHFGLGQFIPFKDSV